MIIPSPTGDNGVQRVNVFGAMKSSVSRGGVLSLLAVTIYTERR